MLVVWLGEWGTLLFSPFTGFQVIVGVVRWLVTNFTISSPTDALLWATVRRACSFLWVPPPPRLWDPSPTHFEQSELAGVGT